MDVVIRIYVQYLSVETTDFFCNAVDGIIFRNVKCEGVI